MLGRSSGLTSWAPRWHSARPSESVTWEVRLKALPTNPWSMTWRMRWMHHSWSLLASKKSAGNRGNISTTLPTSAVIAMTILKHSKLDELKIAVLNRMRINDSEDSLSSICPKIAELDLSSNLFDSWQMIAFIAQQLPDLTMLSLRYIKIIIVTAVF